VKRIEAYKSVDGQIFEDEDAANRHDLDCIGEELDALLLIATQATNGNVTRTDQYRMCLRLLEKRNDIKPIIDKIGRYLAAHEEAG
jgi:hypothetical protein